MSGLNRAIALVGTFALVLATIVTARDVERVVDNARITESGASPVPGALTDRGLVRRPMRVPAGFDTTFLGYWDFDDGVIPDPQGWVSADITAQIGLYFHVDDFAGLGGGDFGRLAPLEGAQSLWCGARPDAASATLCGYPTPPGYGNDWNQAFRTSNCLEVAGDVALDFLIVWDSETNYDYTFIEYDRCDDTWVQLHEYDYIGSGFAHHVVADSLHTGSIRLRIRFESDYSWSDADGLWNTDGAVIIDSLTLHDATGIVLPTELFEAETVGDTITVSGNWVSRRMPGYGDFAGLFQGTQVLQEDPCRWNASGLWGFFNGSTYDYSCGGYPAQKVVPYSNERDQYIKNEIWSPWISLEGEGSFFELSVDVYRDLPMSRGFVFYHWRVRSIVDNCPGPWASDNFIYYGDARDWYRATFSVGPFVDPAASHIQVALGVHDLCGEGGWCWWGEYGWCHSHAPLFDNVEVYRMKRHSPTWQVRGRDLFQDNFSSDGTITGTARADAANDILPSSSPGILPGDSVSVTVYGGETGLGFHVQGDSSSGPAVYCFVSVDGPGASVPPAALVGDLRYEVAGTQTIGGRDWTQIRLDSSYTSSGNVVADRYNIDLNDNLFVPGDTVWFFFGARGAAPNANWSYFARPVPTATGETDDILEAAANPDEFTILPAGGWRRGGDILYVDGMDFRGAQPYFDSAFEYLGLLDLVDRYDIREPLSESGNHPSSRVMDVQRQMVPVYNKLIWSCGDLRTTFSDAHTGSEKSDDTGFVLEYLDHLESTGGVYLNGDDVAHEWLHSLSSASAAELRAKFMDYYMIRRVDDVHTNYLDVSPLGVGEATGMFTDGLGPDTLVVFGGCPAINDFDILEPRGASVVQMSYHGRGVTKGAVLSQITSNDRGTNVGFVLSGFSFHYIRDHTPIGYPARAEHLYRIVSWLGNLVDTPTGPDDRIGHSFSLSQNHPNPFNPTTTIEYSIAGAGHVSLRVYNVAGQLVRTLVDEAQTPDGVQAAVWDGRDGAGREVSSGVYFYKLSAKGFTETKKMILLK